MTAEVAIKVENLGKCYHIYDKPQDRLKQMFAGRVKQFYREFWALKDVGFEVKRGEVVGVIGRNGAGKSTLLQLICNTLTPTVGEIEVNGRIAALLELGTGFNPEFTGRENIYLACSILGFNNQKIAALFNEITEFADIGDFIEQPVKTYSSGMYVRLAFAVQACVEPDVLIVDEALAVGDIFFKQKCYQRLETLLNRGVAIVLVSHSMNEIEQFCQRALLLHHGRKIFFGNSNEAVKKYYLVEQECKGDVQKAGLNGVSSAVTDNLVVNEVSVAKHDAFVWPFREDFIDISSIPQASNNAARCLAVAICDQDGKACYAFKQGDTVSFYYEFELLEDLEVPFGGIVIQNEKGIIVHGKHTIQCGSKVPCFTKKGDKLRFRQTVKLDVAVGEYTVEVGLAALKYSDYQCKGNFLHQQFYDKLTRLCHVTNVGSFSVFLGDCSEQGQMPFYGIADLFGECECAINSISK